MYQKTDDDGDDGEDILPIEAIKWPEVEFELILRKPVEASGETIERLLLREPNGGEWEDIFAHPVATRRRFAISLISGVPMKATRLIGIGDLVRGEAYLNSFFEVGQAIGGR